MHEQGPVDFIEVIHNAVPSDVCAAIVARMQGSDRLSPGAVGSGVFPELKRSKGLRISGLDGWRDVDNLLQQAVFAGLLSYLRRYPQALIAPLMLQIQDSNGQPRRMTAEDFPQMEPGTLAELARTCLRPGAINLQWYQAGEGATPTGIASCTRRTRRPRRCIATCCGCCTSTMGSRKARPSSCSRGARSPRVPAAC
ncbi:MAG: hypothetical protein GAK31_03405 [Stenotrophomonas maltophilia]|uniref:Uncharacterized protein n=1 Tax=Stenotrophomonas maltophilia TaxID=40324 RepID=A0A7V8FDL0_STEMA|nr:MAG: hypothetical protein GAK31_03405 [Stenotrophomonas maltophilia]